MEIIHRTKTEQKSQLNGERNGKFNVIYSYTNEKGERKQKWETYETKALTVLRNKFNEIL